MKIVFYFLFSVSFFFIQTIQSQTTIILQPGAEGKDAYLDDYYTYNLGDYPNAFCVAGTSSGNPFTSRSIFEFDLTSIPPGSVILDARLSLYFANNPYNPHFHYGDNRAFLQRVTEPWDEHEVTWYNQPATTTENQVELPASTSETQDYTDIDVRMLIQDMIDDPAGGHGILLKLQVEEMYRRLMFASGDHEDPLKWPRLEITYNEVSGNTVVIQPGEEGKDALVWDAYPDYHFGNSPKFTAMTWSHYKETCTTRALVEFDLSVIPANATITDARLNLYFACQETVVTGHTGDNASWLQLITESWEEDVVTWSTQPEITTDFQVSLPATSEPQMDFTNIDVTELISLQYLYPEQYHGFMLRLADESILRALLFASSDYTETVEFRPKLEVTYTLTSNTIVIQPGAEGKDAQIWSIQANQNFGDIPKFACMGWTHSGVPGVNRGLIEFDLSVIPEGALITDARLNFFFVCLEPSYFGHTGQNDAYIQLITEPWDEHTVTWNNQPAITETDQIHLPPSADPYMDYTDVDVTQLVHKLYTQPEEYHGMMLRLQNENPYRCLLFASGDYMDTVEMHPKLLVTYMMCQQPIADFSHEQDDLSVYFHNESLFFESLYWEFGDGYYSDLEDPWHIYDEPGVYTVTLSAWNDCGYDSIIKILTVPAVKGNQQSAARLNVYPNVAYQDVTLSTNITGTTDLLIMDTYGRKVINSTLEFFEGQTHRINVSQLHPGIYFVRITQGNRADTRKLIISR